MREVNAHNLFRSGCAPALAELLKVDQTRSRWVDGGVGAFPQEGDAHDAL